MIQVIYFFKSIYLFFCFLVDGLISLFQILLSVPGFVAKVGMALPPLVSGVIVGLVIVCIAYKVVSLGGSGE